MAQLQRRVVLVRLGALLLTLPASRVLFGCSSGDDGGRDAGTGAPDAGQADGGSDAGSGDAGNGDAGTGPQSFTFTSTNVNGHTHTLIVQAEELNDTPASGVSRDTSEALGHTHNVELSELELDEIAAGGTVTVTTSVEDGHSHTFEFSRM